MAVKASSNITLFHVIDIDSTTIYYLLQSSTANPPSKPTTDNPGGNWTTTEPTYTEGSTNTLYTVTKTKFSDGTFEYTPVSKSTSYEAAKAAYNKAYNTENTLNNYISSKELIVGTQTAATNAWTGVAGFSSLVDGQEILYWLPYAGNSSSATLNLTLSGGSTTGAKNVYYGGTTRVTTHYPAGSIIRMVYRQNVSIAGSTTLYTGWWCDANYDSNNYDRLRYQNNIKSDQTYLGNSRIAAQGTNGLYSIITRGFSFKIDSPILYVGSTLNPVTTGNNNYLMYSGINITNNICWNCNTATEATVNKGYSGTKITGTSTTGTVFSDSGITAAVVDDIYINTSTYYLYKCTVAGNAATAQWVYVKSLYKPVGKRWYNGTKITGTDTTAKVFSGSGISSAGVGDYYYNTGTGGYYECTLAGNASTAKWKYNGLLIENYKTIYLRGTLEDGIFTVDDIPMTTTIPEEDDGLYYMSLGSVYSLTAYGLFPEHPMYKYVNGEFKSLNQVSYDAQALADNINVTINGVGGLNDRISDNEDMTSFINKVMEALENTILGSNTIASDSAPEDTTKYWLDSLTGHFKQYVNDNWVDVMPDDILTTVKNVKSDVSILQGKVVLEFTDINERSTFNRNWSETQQTIEQMNQRFEFSSEGLIISSTDTSTSTYKLVLNNNSIVIKGQNDQDLSWWNPNGFVSKNIECETLSFKKQNVENTPEFKWMYNTNDSISFRKV